MTLLNHFIFAIFAQLSSVELMSGIKELELLLSNMEPVLDERDFVFLFFPNARLGSNAGAEPHRDFP
ncbi:ACT domain-containing protein [Bacteroides thetaiotaomicron]|uniref:ACT domain-containing protein n=1 Tax=Bacteroides thetaiotaomicron TaxID=818 RepID=UPI0039C20942